MNDRNLGLPGATQDASSSQLDAATLRAVIDTQALINEAGLTLAEMLEVVVERTRAVTKAQGAVVELAEGDEMVYAAVNGTTVASLGLRLRIDSSLSGQCVTTGTVLRCDDSETDPRVDREACRQVGARSMVVSPLRHRDGNVGALKILSDQPRAFTDDHVALLEIMAGFIATSLTHAREFEGNLRSLRETQRLSAALDSFSSHVAHDLKNHFAVLVGASQELQESRADPDSRDMLVQIIERKALAGSALVSDLLNLARASRSPQREPIDLGVLIDEVGRVVPGLTVTNECGGHSISADLVSVRQALINLMTNAARYGSREGASEVTVVCQNDESGCRISVSDRGEGVDPKAKHRIFQAFERSGGQNGDGSGLGLAIVAAAAEAHGGHAGCDETPGGGATFWFTLAYET